MARLLASLISVLLVLSLSGIVLSAPSWRVTHTRPEALEPGGGSGATEPDVRFDQKFRTDPLLDGGALVAGDALDRLTWQPDAPAFAGDPAGSLRVLYDSSLPAGWFGFPLPALLDESRTFTAGAAFVIASEGFAASPEGFFQISWGLWNSSTTGLNRTGSFTDYAADTFELIEFDYFPNVSPFFGGPFLAPTLFGAATGPDAFLNFASLFDLKVGLPLDVPLLAVLEHRPEVDALTVQVYRIVDAEHVVPLNGAVGVAPLGFLSQRDYEVDTIGLTLWNDGFGGPTPALTAEVDFHALTAITGLADRPERMLAPGDDESSDDEESDDDD